MAFLSKRIFLFVSIRNQVIRLSCGMCLYPTYPSIHSSIYLYGNWFLVVNIIFSYWWWSDSDRHQQHSSQIQIQLQQLYVRLVQQFAWICNRTDATAPPSLMRCFLGISVPHISNCKLKRAFPLQCEPYASGDAGFTWNSLVIAHRIAAEPVEIWPVPRLSLDLDMKINIQSNDY